jgi:hypothetical protein
MPATALSDAELLDQARNSDEAAFTELYVRHQPAAAGLASTYRRLGDPEAPSATVALMLQDPAADPNVPPEVHELATETIGIDLPEG